MVEVDLILTLLCCVVSMIGSVNCEYDPDKEYTVKNTLQNLNDYLVDNTRSTNTEENFTLLTKLYAKHRKDKKADKKLLEADELFLALKTINDGNLCTPYGNSVILNMSNNLRENQGPMSFPTRIEGIFGKYFDKWMQKCGSSYPRALRETLQTMDSTKLSYLDTFFNEAIQLYENKDDPYSQGKTVNKLMNMASAFTYVQEVRQCDYILRKLQEIAKKDPRAKSEEERTIFVGDEKKGEIAFKKSKFHQYYVEPCKYYVHQLGNSVFKPAFLGYKRNGRKLLHEEDLEFYRAWAKYKLCSRNTDLTADHLASYALTGQPSQAGYAN